MGADGPARAWWRRSPWVLVALLVSLAVVWAVELRRSQADPQAPRPASNAHGARQPEVTPPSEAPPEVCLRALEALPPAPADSSRNPFRFQPVAPPAVPVVRPRPAPAEAGQLEAPGRTGAPAAPAPITLKFIGVIEAPGVGKIAALTDGQFVFHGREGEVIEGRYRIVKIGVESIVLEHVDGRGRQTIRLTG